MGIMKVDPKINYLHIVADINQIMQLFISTDLQIFH